MPKRLKSNQPRKDKYAEAFAYIEAVTNEEALALVRDECEILMGYTPYRSRLDAERMGLAYQWILQKPYYVVPGQPEQECGETCWYISPDKPSPDKP